MHTIGKFATAVLTAALAVAMTVVASIAASQFEGTWKVADTGGKAFEITLAGDGSAKANRTAEGMTGTWKEEGSTAVITWDTGWTTKISKEGDKYTKTAFKKGEPTGGKPVNTSPAEKVKQANGRPMSRTARLNKTALARSKAVAPPCVGLSNNAPLGRTNSCDHFKLAYSHCGFSA